MLPALLAVWSAQALVSVVLVIVLVIIKAGREFDHQLVYAC